MIDAKTLLETIDLDSPASDSEKELISIGFVNILKTLTKRESLLISFLFDKILSKEITFEVFEQNKGGEDENSKKN